MKQPLSVQNVGHTVVNEQCAQWKHYIVRVPLRERPAISPSGESASSCSKTFSFSGKLKHNTELDPRISRLHPRKLVRRS